MIGGNSTIELGSLISVRLTGSLSNRVQMLVAFHPLTEGLHITIKDFKGGVTVSVLTLRNLCGD